MCLTHFCAYTRWEEVVLMNTYVILMHKYVIVGEERLQKVSTLNGNKGNWKGPVLLKLKFFTTCFKYTQKTEIKPSIKMSRWSPRSYDWGLGECFYHITRCIPCVSLTIFWWPWSVYPIDLLLNEDEETPRNGPSRLL